MFTLCISTMHSENVTYLALGSNLGNRHFNLQRVIFEINETLGDVIDVSSIYSNKAVGFDGGDFLNACIAIKTTLTPNALLNRLLQLETRLGRNRNQGEGYASRTIDIDILYYGQNVVDGPDLSIPHPKIPLRNFVLKPLADIAPQFYHPILKKDTRNLLQESRDEHPLTKEPLKLFKNRSALYAQVQFLAIEGNIGAGKTTLAKMIAEDFNGKLVLERFADNPFLPKFYNDQQRYAFPLEMSFLADRYQQFVDDTTQFNLFKNFMVSDYDIFKSLIFAQVTLAKEEFNLYRKLFNIMYKEVKKPDLYIYLNQPTDRLLTNIKRRGRAYEQNISASYLNAIHNGYRSFITSHPEQETLIINLESLDFVTNRDDYLQVLSRMEERLLQLIF